MTAIPMALHRPAPVDYFDELVERPIAFVDAKNGEVSEADTVAWGVLPALLSDVKIGPKDGPAWMPVEIDVGRRTAARVRSISYVVLDVEAKAEPVKDENGNAITDDVGDIIKNVIGDEPPGVDDMLAELELFGWRAVVHTSYSHTTEHARYRVVFDLSRPLLPAELRPLAMHVASLIGVSDCVDTSCMEPARLFYLPRCRADRVELFQCGSVEGDPLDVEGLLHDAAEIEAAHQAARSRRHGERSGNVIASFNQAHDIGAILARHGYIAKGRRRWLHPSSTTGEPGVRLLPDSTPERIYSSHGCDPLNDGHAHDCFDVFRILDHGGDVAAAVKAAARLLGMDYGKAAGGSTGGAAPDNVGGAPDEAGDGATANPWPAPLDLLALAAREPVPPRHIIGDWLPAGEVTLLAGHGGGGKSGLALYIAACVALGREPWAGAVVERRRVYYVSAEDRADILDCRLVRIARHLGVPLGLLAGHLNVIDASTLNCELVIESSHEAVLTNMYRTLRDTVPRDALIVLDGASDLYGASEIVRRHVRFYIRTLRRLVGPEGAVLLLAHVDKGAARDSTTTDRYSGSTAWHNSVRARWSLAGDTTKGELVLTLAKANHAKPGAEIPWSWDAAGHLYVPGGAPGAGIVEAIRDRTEQAAIVRALIDATTAGISVPSATNGRRTAFHVLSVQPAFPDSLRSGAPEIRRFWGHIEALRAMGQVADATIARSDRHRVAVLIVTQEGMRACGQ